MWCIPLMNFKEGGNKDVCAGVCVRDDRNGLNRDRVGNYCSSSPFRAKGQGMMGSVKEGAAFIALMLSAGAMDSENIVVPGIGCVVSALLLLVAGKRKKFAGRAQNRNYIRVSALIIVQRGGAAMGYKICPYCGAHLDPDERCDCRDEVATSQEKSPPVETGQAQEKYNKQYLS